MIKQTVTSASTSINKNKLPAIYKKIDFKVSDRVLDYGCGKYIEHICEYVQNKHCGYFPYDKYNQSDGLNNLTLFELSNRECATIGIISNVLNVIDSDEAIMELLHNVSDLVDGVIYITVYEGDGSGVGRYTKNDCFQRNMKLKDYIPLIENAGYKCTTQKGMIIIKNY